MNIQDTPFATMTNELQKLREERDSALEKLARYEKALRFYANGNHYSKNGMELLCIDTGYEAQQAISATAETKGEK